MLSAARMADPLVSVVIPNYNYARFLGQAIDSVLAQTYPSVEIVVVDDGSKDESAHVLRQYEGRVRPILQVNQGVSAARNNGIAASRGEAIAFLDSDDVWDPRKIELQVRKLEDPAVGLVHSGIEYVDSNGRSLAVDLAGAEGKILRRHALFRVPTVRSGSTALVRRSCLDKVGLFDVSLSTSADWDMWRRIGAVSEVRMIPLPLVKYRLHDGAMHRNLAVFERDMLHAFERMFDDPSSNELLPIRRKCYANLYATLCASYSSQHAWRKALKFAGRSLLERPDTLVMQALGMPWRRIRRRLTNEHVPM